MTPEVQVVVEALRRYIDDNPHACDSLDGIARWWLGGRFPRPRVEAAMAALLEEGTVERVSATDGRVRWRRRGAIQ
ncbi:MAG TPA: hypothetical protein VIN03_09735 [Roseateles sp.]